MTVRLEADFEVRFSGGPVLAPKLELTFEGGSIAVLFGPSGAGKTTVLRCLAGLERPRAGAIRFAGATWFDAARRLSLPPQARDIGLLTQEQDLFPHLSVADNVGYGLRRAPAAERAARVGELLESMALGGCGARRVTELSGGQRRRVALARALARRPRLLLLDEPFASLDAPLRDELLEALRRLLARQGVPALLVTHDRSEALALGDRMVVLSGGRVRQEGPLLEVFNRPVDAEVARIVGVETLLAGRVLGVENGLAGTASAGGVFVALRGEDVLLVRERAEAGSARNRYTARIAALRAEGPLLRVELDAGFRFFALVTHPAGEELALREGGTVTALIKASALHLIPHGGGRR